MSNEQFEKWINMELQRKDLTGNKKTGLYKYRQPQR